MLATHEARPQLPTFQHRLHIWVNLGAQGKEIESPHLQVLDLMLKVGEVHFIVIWKYTSDRLALS